MRSVLFFDYNPINDMRGARSLRQIAEDEAAYQKWLASRGPKPLIAMPPAAFSEADMKQRNQQERIREVKQETPDMSKPSACATGGWMTGDPPSEGIWETFCTSALWAQTHLGENKPGYLREWKDGKWFDHYPHLKGDHDRHRKGDITFMVKMGRVMFWRATAA